MEYREHIDALRGIAVLLVVIFHTFPDVVSGGFIGVDVFFVISGYLITSIILSSIESDEFSLKEFYAKRIKRLFPALLTVLLFALVVGWLVLFPEEYEQLGKHVSKNGVKSGDLVLLKSRDLFKSEKVLLRADDGFVVYASSPTVYSKGILLHYSMHSYEERRLIG